MVKTAADVEPVGSILYIDKKSGGGVCVVPFDAETRVDPKIGGKLKFKIMLIMEIGIHLLETKQTNCFVAKDLLIPTEH